MGNRFSKKSIAVFPEFDESFLKPVSPDAVVKIDKKSYRLCCCWRTSRHGDEVKIAEGGTTTLSRLKKTGHIICAVGERLIIVAILLSGGTAAFGGSEVPPIICLGKKPADIIRFITAPAGATVYGLFNASAYFALSNINIKSYAVKFVSLFLSIVAVLPQMALTHAGLKKYTNDQFLIWLFTNCNVVGSAVGTYNGFMNLANFMYERFVAKKDKEGNLRTSRDKLIDAFMLLIAFIVANYIMLGASIDSGTGAVEIELFRNIAPNILGWIIFGLNQMTSSLFAAAILRVIDGVKRGGLKGSYQKICDYLKSWYPEHGTIKGCWRQYFAPLISTLLVGITASAFSALSRVVSSNQCLQYGDPFPYGFSVNGSLPPLNPDAARFCGKCSSWTGINALAYYIVPALVWKTGLDYIFIGEGPNNIEADQSWQPKSPCTRLTNWLKWFFGCGNEPAESKYQELN